MSQKLVGSQVLILNRNKVDYIKYIVNKVGHIHIQLDHVLIAKIHLSPAAMMRKRFLEILSTRTFRYLFETPTHILKIIYLVKRKEL
jgi:hypothetical protein